jgi:hypothetical protein
VYPLGRTNNGMLRRIPGISLQLCAAMGILVTLLACQLAAQASEPKTAPAQDPAPSLQPQTAQSTSTSQLSTRVHTARRRLTLDDHVRTLAKSLNLTDAQQAKIKKILEQRQQETLRLRSDSSISGSERIDRFRALQDQTVLRIRSVLDDEQKKKYDPLAVRKITPAPDQKSVEDWMKATTPK